MKRLVACFALTLLSASTVGSSAYSQQARATTTAKLKGSPDDNDDIVVTGHRLLKADSSPKAPPRCVRRPGDPVDEVPVGVSETDQGVIAPDKNGKLKWQPDRDPVLGPAVWQRAGTGIGQYVFRVPDDGLPMCIGAAVISPSGWAQLRQVVKATPYMVDRYLHFSAIVAARNAAKIRFWLAGGGYGGRAMGGDTHLDDLKGTFGWEQVDFIAGPVPYGVDHVSYGLLLWGTGDVWLTDVKMQVQTRDQLAHIPVLPLSPDFLPWEHGGGR